MTLAEKKRWLVLECTCDRMHWKVKRMRARRRTRSSNLLHWVHQIDHWVGPFLPRWWRVGFSAFRSVMR
ncbi:hypothetical protein [Actomonas aquatica]|uniref:Uncharacterized protein n=1 Tax=Actomonas aquatica TaxID=2866162 RepID=A0ABZ1CF37_9BACT|nr:hypothetical protein [Opitutus sp. WL0086]WRQ89975.1 hypothetical protein K1X11_011200 [Opitutus sp. WL0086]